MKFIHKVWRKFCQELAEKNIHSIPACQVAEQRGQYLVLKHDVETDVAKAYSMALIESCYGHRGSYYVQAYLMEKERNVQWLRKMQQMGHEISYHYDVMDSCRGNLQKAMEEFEQNRLLFEENGFPIITVCQHGNPVVERVGYNSNRDFFRSEAVQALYPSVADIMVDFPWKANTEYTYFSDAGRQFQLIYDPINNDIAPSDDKNIAINSMEQLTGQVCRQSCIVSVHPHRWASSALRHETKTGLFRVIRAAARLMMRVPLMKKLMSKYYYLAKKF